jgi:hypothetical protein
MVEMTCVQIFDIGGDHKNGIADKVNTDAFVIDFMQKFNKPCGLLINKDEILLKYPKLNPDCSSDKIKNEIESFLKTVFVKFQVKFNNGNHIEINSNSLINTDPSICNVSVSIVSSPSSSSLSVNEHDNQGGIFNHILYIRNA